ncbi:MAG: hypothetical protein GY851_21925 [bacterium]|nr:hypothetical protein [bacterium]
MRALGGMWLVAVAAIMIPTPSHAGISTVAGIEVNTMQQDATGKVWALARPDQSYLRLCYWSGETWIRTGFTPSPPDVEEPLNQQGLHVGRDGAVYCAWIRHPDSAWYISRHMGDTSEVAAFVTTSANRLSSFVVNGDDVWFVIDRCAYYAQANGSSPVEGAIAARLPTTNYHKKRANKDERPRYEAPSLLPDDDGRCWAWGCDMPHEPWNQMPRGLWRLEKGEATRHEVVPGVPDREFGVVAHRDRDSLWLGVTGDGLYEVDKASVQGRRVPDPEPGAFRYVQQITQQGNEWFVVSSAEWCLRKETWSGAALWRLRAGKWERMADGLGTLVPRPIVTTDQGLWVGTQCNGILHISPRGGVRNVDWRAGMPLSRVGYLAETSDDRLLAAAGRHYDEDELTVAATPDSLLADGAAARNVETFDAYTRLVKDRRGHIWAVTVGSGDTLSEWDGRQWTQHPLPDGAAAEHASNVLVDVLDRIWVWRYRVDGYYYGNIFEGAVDIFVPAEQKWIHFPTFLKALTAQTKLRNPVFSFQSEGFPDVRFTKDGRIAFNVSSYREFFYYDKRRWHHFERDALDGERVARLYFNADGVLQADTSGHNYESGNYVKRGWTYTGKGKWERLSGPPEAPAAPSPPSIRIDDSARKGPRDISTHLDAYGTPWCWFVRGSQLFKASSRLEASQFAEGERHPFMRAGRLTATVPDGTGNVFLGIGNRRYALVRSRAPLPDTSAQASLSSADTFTVSLSNTTPNAWYVWRLDGGPWTLPDNATEIEIAQLGEGEHLFEAYAIDTWLQTDPSPVQVSLTVDSSLDEQIASWITDLAHADYAKREAAIHALAREPGQALPALKQARQSADEDGRWWIDTAIEHIGRIAP